MNAPPNTIPLSAVMGVPSTAKFIGVSESKIRQWIREKRIPYIQLDGRIVFLADSILSWLRDIQISPQNDIVSNNNRSDKKSTAVTSNELWRKALKN